MGLCSVKVFDPRAGVPRWQPRLEAAGGTDVQASCVRLLADRSDGGTDRLERDGPRWRLGTKEQRRARAVEARPGIPVWPACDHDHGRRNLLFTYRPPVRRAIT
ncbi:MAG: hypothetical protein NVSMB55_22520 [Mycobacteriales bacterium]